MQRRGRILVIVPTYQERENLAGLLRRLHAVAPEVDALVVDDNSPDGTGELADALAAADPRVHVLHQPVKAGLGAAYVAGFRWALRRDYDTVVEMDADGSHPPEDLPRLLDALSDADVVLGSRYVPGGQVVNWPRHRRWLSRGGNLYCQLALGVRITDLTSGYRAYHRRVLAELPLADIASQGYCFQVDLAWRAWQAGFRVEEVPITFTERETGRSKMTGGIVREALWQVTRWGVQHWLAALGRAAGRARR